MSTNHEFSETIGAGDTASIENTHSGELSVSVISGDGSRVDIELAPGQVLALTAGSAAATVLLHQGDPVNLLIIKPDSAS